MKITRQQLRKIIKEALSGPPQSAEEWMYWGGEFGLSAEEDNDGQTIFYLDARSYSPSDFAAIVKEAEHAGASIESDNYGQTIIYTGVNNR